MSVPEIYGLFFFAERTATGITYLDTLENWPMPQLLEDFGETLIFQQDGAPPHYHNSVTGFLNETFPNRLIGRGGPTTWPPRSSDLTSMDFFLWGCAKDLVYVPPLPHDINDLMIRVRESI
jgi:hypothetical protein